MLVFFVSVADSQARQIDFAKLHLGIGFWFGGSTQPSTTLVPASPTKIPNYMPEFGGELIIPVGEEVFIRPLYGVQRFSTFVASAVDPQSNRIFGQSAAGSLRIIGGKLSINSFMSQNKKRRVYFGAGGGLASLTATLRRDYLSGGSGLYVQTGTGAAWYWDVHAGAAVMAVQNYSLSLETGYRYYEIDKIVSQGSVDLRGATIVGDKTIYTIEGNKSTFTIADPYVILILQINL